VFRLCRCRTSAHPSWHQTIDAHIGGRFGAAGDAGFGAGQDRGALRAAVLGAGEAGGGCAGGRRGAVVPGAWPSVCHHFRDIWPLAAPWPVLTECTQGAPRTMELACRARLPGAAHIRCGARTVHGGHSHPLAPAGRWRFHPFQHADCWGSAVLSNQARAIHIIALHVACFPEVQTLAQCNSARGRVIGSAANLGTVVARSWQMLCSMPPG
jgi:hypothetical protein